MRVLKFGGSSVGTPQSMRAVSEIVRYTQERDGRIVVVVSAFHKVTDQLIALATLAAKGADYGAEFTSFVQRHITIAEQLLSVDSRPTLVREIGCMVEELGALLRGIALTREATPRATDAVMSFGERLSATIITALLSNQGLAAEFLDARSIIVTDARFGEARVQIDSSYRRIRERFMDHDSIQVVTGFIGATPDGQTTTLGRGGSDYTAALVGAALDADEIEIWTDVDGVMSADPRKVPNAFTLSDLTYEEAMELAHFGAKVIFPPTMQPALVKNIPLRIKNTFNPDAPGALIAANRKPHGRTVTGLTSISDITLLRVEGSGMIGVPGVTKRLFGALGRRSISVILITQASSEHSICLALEPRVADTACEALEEEFASEMRMGQINPVVVQPGCAIIAIIGENMRSRPGISGRLFSALGQHGINVIAIAQGSSELNISFVVAREDESRALNVLHDAFFLPQDRHLNLYLVGAGLVGTEFLRQLDVESTRLREQHNIHISLRGVANSKSMLLATADKDISPTAWREQLKETGEATDIDTFVTRMVMQPHPSTVLVDCTASDETPTRYAGLLRAGISVVTPNKRGPAGALTSSLEHRRVACEGGAAYLYETTVGAALPILSTLRDLRATGDEILSIEGVLSGTLSYLFNSFDGARSFSEAVRDAQQRGYTEPDPRDDLSGRDVARKLLILARECGVPLELKDVQITPLLSEECLNAPSVEAFYAALAREDGQFERVRAEAEHTGHSLRYLARLEDDRARVGLTAVDASSPFIRLAGADNMVVFTTRRYRERPLVIQGPGAGAEVTAAGVLADVLRIAR